MPGDGETTEPAGVEELVIYSAWANANRDLTVLVGAETPEEEKGAWRRDWTFTQDMLEDLTGRHDLSKDGLGTNYPYLPLTGRRGPGGCRRRREVLRPERLRVRARRRFR